MCNVATGASQWKIILNPQDFYKIFLQYQQICTDSRKVQPGCLFFGLRGDVHNGNDYAAAALQQGCVLAVVDDPKVVKSDQYLLVEDSLVFLQELAAFHRSKLNAPVIGLTGTNGKTTTKELINNVLKQKYRTIANSGNLNNHLGVPLTLLRADHSTEMIIVEMGANHPGEIRTLCQIARPTHGLVTNIGKAHLEGFGSFEGVRQTKRELFDFLKDTGGTVFINSDDPTLTGLIGDYPTVTYGSSNNSAVRGTGIISTRFLDVRWENPGDGIPAEIQTHLTGTYNLHNILAAVAVGVFFHVSPSQIVYGLESYKPDNLRSQWEQTARNSLLIDAYNANPSSMSIALNHFALLDLPNKVVILGDMFELGKESAREHLDILKIAQTLQFHKVLVTGAEFFAYRERFPFGFFKDPSQLQDYLEVDPLSGCTVLLKGSRGMKLERLVPYL